MSDCIVQETKDPTLLREIVIVANVIGFIYNIPQVVHTIRTKSANDLSGIFLLLRMISACLWIVYTTILWSPDVLISWLVTGGSTTILMVYKIKYSTEPWTNEWRIYCPCIRSSLPRQPIQDEPDEHV